MKTKRPFTLIELGLALLILSLASSAVIWGIQSSLQTHQFRKSCASLALTLQEAQLLSIAYNTDTRVTLKKTTTSWTCRLDSDEPSPLFHPRQKKLKALTHITSQGKEMASFTFLIPPSGSILPATTLELHSSSTSSILDLTCPLLIKSK